MAARVPGRFWHAYSLTARSGPVSCCSGLGPFDEVTVLEASTGADQGAYPAGRVPTVVATGKHSDTTMRTSPRPPKHGIRPALTRSGSP